MFQVVYGVWKLSALSKPRITIFGGGRLDQKTKYTQQAFDLAERFVENGVTVLTGGGAGVMHAANCGALSKTKGKKHVKSVGIGVKELGEGQNPCVQEYFELEYFFARKWLLTRYSVAFIIFPGGFGTLDELAEVITLVQTKKLPRVPIILFSKSYWKDFMEWIHFSAIEKGLIKKEHLELFTVTDDLDEVFDIIHEFCECMMTQKKKK